MRIFGYILLVGGFIWLLLCAAYVGPVSRAVLVHRYERLPKQETFSREETLAEMRDVSRDALHSYPGIVAPALVMLCGGILIDRARRNSKNRDGSQQTRPEQTQYEGAQQ